MKYSEFKNIVKQVADECGATEKQLQNIYLALELDHINQAGIDASKAGESIRDLLINLNPFNR